MPHIRGSIQKTFQTAEQALTKNAASLVLLVVCSRHKSKQHSSFNSIMLLFDSIVDFLASQFLLLTVQVAPAWYSCLLLLLLFVTPACYFRFLPLFLTLTDTNIKIVPPVASYAFLRFCLFNIWFTPKNLFSA